MGLEIDWEEELILVTSPTVAVDGQVLHDFIEDQMATPVGCTHGDILRPEGKIEDPNNPGVYSQIIIQLNSPWQIQFWQGSGYTRIYGAKIVGGLNNQPMKATGAAGDITVLESPVDGITVVSGSAVTEQDKLDIADAVWDELLTGALHNIPLSAGRRLREAQQALVIHEGTAQAATQDTITLDDLASSVDDFYARDMVMITDETGAGQARMILSYNGTTKVAKIKHRWSVLPDDTSKFSIKTGLSHADTDLDLDTGYAQAGAADSITLAPDASAIDHFFRYSAIILIGGTGKGQGRIIDGYVGSTRVASIHGTWHIVPDDTTEYQIIDGRAVVNVICPECVDGIADGVWDEATAGHVGAGSTGAAMLSAAFAELVYKIETGRWKIDKVAKQLIFYDPDTGDEIKRFNLLDEDGQPEAEEVYERVPV